MTVQKAVPREETSFVAVDGVSKFLNENVTSPGCSSFNVTVSGIFVNDSPVGSCFITASVEKQLEVAGKVVELLKFTKEDEVIDKLTADSVSFWNWLD
ncbi:hypothetical protein WUBG_12909 [Wuchereria bancrofti]|uniref:Uncharacterized protein n=1 Tax=Wuchereria bancrofti TaxID=6293 RepID=J9EGQ3_WUCBA|nr:hypothetical protein WUBG_12909 [Wuchereria bancrofti]